MIIIINMPDIIAVMIYVFIGIAIASFIVIVPSILFIDKLIKLSERIELPKATVLDDSWRLSNLFRLRNIKSIENSCSACHTDLTRSSDPLCSACQPKTTLFISGWRWTMNDELAQRLFPEYYKKN